MDEKMRKAMSEAAEEWCEKYSSPGDFEEFGQAEAFWYGTKSCLEYLGKAALEFDEESASHRKSILVHEIESSGFIAGARWQFEQDKVRIALAVSDGLYFSKVCHDLEVKLSAAEAEAIKSEWKEIHRWKPYLHWCREWDGLLIDKGDPEFEACLCFNKEVR